MQKLPIPTETQLEKKNEQNKIEAYKWPDQGQGELAHQKSF